MVWRTLVISQTSRLSLMSQQLVCEQGDDKYTIAIEDIGVIVLESLTSTISTALLSSLSENNIVLITCNQYHLPNGLLHAVAPHSRQYMVNKAQISWGQVFKKQLWQVIVKSKIQNQSLCLKYCGQDSTKLEALLPTIKSGDSTNIEAQAAKIYFSLLFENFTRQKQNNPDLVNIMLNYGYSIIRSAVARSVVAHGFIPSIGIHHHNELNNFNLVDDLIEPYRPFVDRVVYSMLQNQDNMEFDINIRRELVNILYKDCLINNETFATLKAIDITASSLLKASLENDISKLKLPAMTVNINNHFYE